MKNIELQHYLLNKGVQKLQDELKIIVSRHTKYPNLYQFNYNQIETPKGSSVAQQCRGIILDADNDWKVVCHTYDRFFNHNEYFPNIDWHSAKVYEKLDGSLIQLFHYDNQWLMSTRGSIEGSGNVGDFDFTFKELFWRTWSDLGYQLPSETNFCFAFELCTKYNRIVVKHDQPRIVLHGRRNIEFGYEEFPYTNQNWEVVKCYDLGTLDGIVESLENVSPYDQEGYVVFDGKNRIKVKSPQYVAVHHLVGGMSKRNMLEIVRKGKIPEFLSRFPELKEIVRKGETSEFLSHFPEWKELHDEIKVKYDSLASELQSVYYEHKHIESQKDFALQIKGHRLSGVLFALRKGVICNAKEGLSDMNIKHLEEALDL